MKKIFLTIVFMSTMFIGNANSTSQGTNDCFDAVCKAADKAVNKNPSISDKELTDVMNKAYADCWKSNQKRG